MARGKLGDTPTIKMHPVRFAQYARKADAKARQGKAPSAPEIEVRTVEVDAGEVGVGVDVDDDTTQRAPRAPAQEEADSERVVSDVMPASRSADSIAFDAVPVIAVSREDLAWFELEADAQALLARIDGRTTVADVLSAVPLQRARALALLKELEKQRVIALS